MVKLFKKKKKSILVQYINDKGQTIQKKINPYLSTYPKDEYEITIGPKSLSKSYCGISSLIIKVLEPTKVQNIEIGGFPVLEDIKFVNFEENTDLLSFGFYSNKKIESIDLGSFKNSKNLSNITIDGNKQLKTIDLSSLVSKNLSNITITGNKQLKTVAFPSLKLQKLETLNLSGNGLKHVDLSLLEGNTVIEKINLSINEIGALDLSPLSSCTKLEELELGGNELGNSLDITPLALLMDNKEKNRDYLRKDLSLSFWIFYSKFNKKIPKLIIKKKKPRLPTNIYTEYTESWLGTTKYPPILIEWDVEKTFCQKIADQLLASFGEIWTFPSIAELLSVPVNTVLLIINRLKQLGLIHGYVDRETGGFMDSNKVTNDYYSKIIDTDFKDYMFRSAKMTPNETRRLLNILSDVREDIPITIERIHEMTGFTKRRIKYILSYVLRESLIDGEYLPTEDVFIKSKSTERKKTYVDNVEQNKVILDLLEGKAISISSLQNIFDCSEIAVPKKLKSCLSEEITGILIVLKSRLIMFEKHPPKVMCQLCLGKISSKTYFQCTTCKRYTCKTHYVESRNRGYKNCITCGSEILFFPFSCSGCSIDFSSVDEYKEENCPLCGYPLPKQDQLILGFIDNNDIAKDKIQNNQRKDSDLKSLLNHLKEI